MPRADHPLNQKLIFLTSVKEEQQQQQTPQKPGAERRGFSVTAAHRHAPVLTSLANTRRCHRSGLPGSHCPRGVSASPPTRARSGRPAAGRQAGRQAGDPRLRGAQCSQQMFSGVERPTWSMACENGKVSAQVPLSLTNSGESCWMALPGCKPQAESDSGQCRGGPLWARCCPGDFTSSPLKKEMERKGKRKERKRIEQKRKEKEKPTLCFPPFLEGR